MRVKPTQPLELRDKTLGGDNPLICVPIVAETLEELASIISSLEGVALDIVEWRADFFEDVEDFKEVEKAIELLRQALPSIPIIFTYRSNREGGQNPNQVEEKRYAIIEKVIRTRKVDIVDIELISGEENIKRIKECASNNSTSLIVSYHNFEETPSKALLIEKMEEALHHGADIVKTAIMANYEEDVLDLLSLTLRMRRKHPEVPIITMSMGEKGIVSRVIGGLFGSDLTFGSIGKISAPGQITVDMLKKAMEIYDFK